MDTIAKTEKHCNTCDTTKPVEAFSKDRAQRDGLVFQCKSCRAAYKRSDAGRMADAKYQRSDKGRKTWAKASAKYSRTDAGRKVQARADAKLRTTVIKRLGGCCVRCSAMDNLEFDHIHDNGYEHRLEVVGRNASTDRTYRWMRDAPLSEVLHGKYAIQLLCNACHRTKDKWSQKPDLFFKEQAA